MAVERNTRKIGSRATPAGGRPAVAPSSGTRRGPAAGARGAGGRGKTRPPEDEPAEEGPRSMGGEEEEGGSAREPRGREDIKPTGIPLAIRFAVIIAGSVAVAAGLLLLLARDGTTKATNDEINAAGVRMVKVLGCFEFEYWNDIGTHANTIKMNARIKELVEGLGKTITAKKPESEEEKKAQEKAVTELTEAGNSLTQALESMISEDPLSRMGNSDLNVKMGVKSPDIIDIVILNNQNQALCQVNKGSQSVSLSNQVPLGENEGVKIVEGYYQSSTGGGRTRSYTKTIIGKDGQQLGKVLLFLSAAKIDEVQKRITSALIIPAGIVVVIGAIIGLVFANLVTKPVKMLVRDIQAVAEGDLEHQTKAISTDEIGIVAKAFNSMTKSLKDAHEAELETKALEHELNIATEIQSNLLPKKIPKIPGFDVSAYYRPSKEVGGDYYDFIPIDSDNLGIVVADVSGKGIPGSMVMTMARSLLRMEAERNLSTADTLIKTNRILAKDIRRGMFVTAMYMILNVKTRTLLVSSAGHNPLHLWRHKTKSQELVNPNGIALGFDKGPIFERTVKEQRYQLYPGDRFTAYTDGVVEAMNLAMEEYGDDRFFGHCRNLADRESNQFINVVVKDLDEHKGSGPQHDDITLVTFRFMP
ncbi:MAG: SpoIIE family protein phosphatase [Planctomycetes bacterium]|nr:SpoIIE family protein phosphatase [Planctomycetota bacterium]